MGNTIVYVVVVEIPVLGFPELKKCLFYVPECMYTALARKLLHRIDINQTHNEHINSTIKDALGLQHTMFGLVNEATGQTLTEGE